MNLSYEIKDEYEHLDDGLEYILENVLSEEVLKNGDDEGNQLKTLYNSILINCCDCKRQNSTHNSSWLHVDNYMFDNEHKEYVLNNRQHRRDVIYECSNTCQCEPENCPNRLVQYGPRKFLKIVQSPRYQSKGLITTQDIPKGAFVCEYAGELLTREEAKRILRQNKVEGKMNYVLFLIESCTDSSVNQILVTIVDPSIKGNIGRYLNHSCDPNCRIVSVRVDCPIPKIAIFTKRFIRAGEELCFNYNEGVKFEENIELTNDLIPCLCGSDNCKTYLPNSDHL